MFGKIGVAVQTDYVIEIDTNSDISSEDHIADDLNLQLVDLNQFIQLFHKYLPKSPDDPTKIWHNLLGNHPSGNVEKQNNNVRYLSSESCIKILNHLPLFTSGIDFHHLPSGFFLTKNPYQGGVREVLHFSDYLATHNPQTNSLAIILSPKSVQKNDELQSGFTPEQAVWYKYLFKKIQGKGELYCTKKEFHAAFITFSDILRRLGLEFYPPDFSALTGNFNPIVLLGRWITVLTQPGLKKVDLESQWHQLLNLELTQGYNVLRTVSDYQNTEKQAGFVLPEMFHPNTQEFSFINTINHAKQIRTTVDFWRYLAYQAQRNSIDFYRQALKEIDSMSIGGTCKVQICQILAASTTGDLVQSQHDEQNDFRIWKDFCTLIEHLPTSTQAMRVHTQKVGAERLRDEFIHHLNRLAALPSIPFLQSIAECIENYIKSLNIVGMVWADLRHYNPLEGLEELSNKLNFLISTYRTNIYQGARFYFNNGKWSSLDIQRYIELQFSIHFSKPTAAPFIIPYLSTFKIERIEEAQLIDNLVKKVPEAGHGKLNYCLNLFKDAQQQLSQADYGRIIDVVIQHAHAESFIPLLENLQTLFSSVFPEQFFEQKMEQLIDAQYGLTELQKENVYDLRLSKEQSAAIIRIESILVRKQNTITTETLNQLNEKFVQMSRLFTETDFTDFTIKLASIGEDLPENPDTLSRLITVLCERRTLEGFNQIFFRNQIEKVSTDTIIDKFIVYITSVKPLGKAQGPISSLNIYDLLTSIVLNCHTDSLEENFIGKISHILELLKNVCTEHPQIQQHLLDSCNFIPEKQTPQYFDNMYQYVQLMQTLAQLLKTGEDEESKKNMLAFYVTLANFKEKPLELLNLWQQIELLNEPAQKIFFLSLVNSLIQNKQSITGLNDLITKINEDPNLFQLIATECSHPPYPEIKTMTRWIAINRLQEKYQNLSQRPYGKRHFDFGFIEDEFALQKSKFIGVNERLFTVELATALKNEILKNRRLSVQELRQNFIELKSLEALNASQKMILLCTCIEMLARTTAQNYGTPAKQISQELNTTQIMALYAMLNTPNSKLISEIDTGEGKSRIMMILAACQVAQGKTVDFMTSDMPLAERDYLTYNAFFTALNIRTSLISLNTPKQLYQKGGINFSDNGQLLLLRNKSDIALDPFAYLEEDENKRCLLIDEVDKFKHDKSRDSYNYAAKSKKLSGFIWVYPLLVQFVRKTLQENPEVKFDVKEMNLTKAFVDFVAIHDTDDLHKASIANLERRDEKQLVTWLNSAYTALRMKKDHEFKVTEATADKLIAVRDVDGHTRYTRKVLVSDNGRPVEGSTFSEGVHQCLCAIQNEDATKEEFIIQPENVTQRALFPVSFMAKYDRGQIFGVSGTTRYEGPLKDPVINYEHYDYLRVPRQKSLRRQDKPIWGAKDKVQQLDFIKRCILEKLQQNPQQPILLICENDEQSKELYEALLADTQMRRQLNHHVRVHGLTEKKDEIAAITTAGLPGKLTVSTAGMFSRGVDIHADNLLVLASYVPTLEDEIQIKGRTGRFGKIGEYRMIPNLSTLDGHVNGRSHNLNFEISKIQKNNALNAAQEEEVSKLYATFLEHIHQLFLSSLAKKAPLEQLKHLEIWEKFLGDLQKDWDSEKPALLQAIAKVDQAQFTHLFRKFATKWESSAASFIKEEPQNFARERALTTFESLQHQQAFFKPHKPVLQVQRGYDVSDDGQARIYSSLFAQEIATLKGERPLFADFRAWREGRGALFPDLMATLRGERPLFANLRATIARWIATIKAWLYGKPVERPIQNVEDNEPSFEEEIVFTDYSTTHSFT